MPRPSLLLAAFPPELSGLDAMPPPGWRVACTGVGALVAAVTTTRLIAELHPQRVLFIGTCGAYDERLAIGDILAVSEARTVSLDELEDRAFRPGIERTRWETTWTLPFPPHIVAVTPAITKTREGSETLARVAAAEHLEVTGVFAACHQAGIPVAAALAVANRVGPMAHTEWQTHHAAVSAGMVEALRQVLFEAVSSPAE